MDLASGNRISKSNNTIQCVIAVVGMAGAGKSTASRHIASKGYKLVRFGEFTVDEVIRRGLEVTPENERMVREYLRKKHGMDVHAQLALPLIRRELAAGERVVIDGLYSLSEYETLRGELGSQMLVLAVFTPRRERYRRLAERAVRPLTPAEAEQRDIAEIKELEKAGPIALADHTVVNDRTPEEFCRAIEKTLHIARGIPK